MTYLLYNPLANNSKGEQDARQWAASNNVECEFTSLLGITDMKAFFDGLSEGDDVILTGGDGTMNRFANDVYGYEFKNPVYYVKCGSGKTSGNAVVICGFKRCFTMSVTGNKSVNLFKRLSLNAKDFTDFISNTLSAGDTEIGFYSALCQCGGIVITTLEAASTAVDTRQAFTDFFL